MYCLEVITSQNNRAAVRQDSFTVSAKGLRICSSKHMDSVFIARSSAHDHEHSGLSIIEARVNWLRKNNPISLQRYAEDLYKQLKKNHVRLRTSIRLQPDKAKGSKALQKTCLECSRLRNEVGKLTGCCVPFTGIWEEICELDDNDKERSRFNDIRIMRSADICQVHRAEENEIKEFWEV